MKFLPFIKRIVPFVVTFSIGILVTSIFVPLTGTSYEFRKQEHRHGHGRREKFRMLKMEVERLRDENMRLRNRLNEVEGREFQLRPEMELPPAVEVRPFGSVPRQEQ